ncbi:MAG: PAS domain-containing protein [Elusimicrobiota bacterium]|nr:PAS domain-containing protein [Elusimicrobiota bacterium]
MIKNVQEYYQCILDNLTGGLISVDLKGKVIYLNPMAGKILRMDPETCCLDTHYEKAFEAFTALRDVIKETIETGKCVRRAEISIMHANTPLIIGYSTMLVKNHEGAELGVTVIFQDISFVGKK